MIDDSTLLSFPCNTYKAQHGLYVIQYNWKINYLAKARYKPLKRCVALSPTVFGPAVRTGSKLSENLVRPREIEMWQQGGGSVPARLD